MPVATFNVAVASSMIAADTSASRPADSGRHTVGQPIASISPTRARTPSLASASKTAVHNPTRPMSICAVPIARIVADVSDTLSNALLSGLMEIATRHTPAYGVARLTLAGNEQVRVEAGAMMAMSAGVNLASKAEGGIMKSLKRAALGGESFFVSTYTAPGQGGFVD